MKKSIAFTVLAVGGAFAVVAVTRSDLGATTAPSTTMAVSTQMSTTSTSSTGNGIGNGNGYGNGYGNGNGNGNGNGYVRRSQRRNGYQGRNVPLAATGVPTGFEEVARRNLFVHGGQYVDPFYQQPAPERPRIPGTGVTPPTMLVFTGVMLTDVGKVAFLENQEEGHVDRVQVGDAVSNGKISAIDLNSLDFKDADGHVNHIEIGNNLAGGSAWGVSGAPSMSMSATTTQNSADSGANLSILEKLRKRRQQELGGK